MKKKSSLIFILTLTLLTLTFEQNLPLKAAEVSETKPTKYDFLSETEYQIIYEMNLARTDPKGYAKFLENLRDNYKGTSFYFNETTLMETSEGIDALNEAIAYLNNVFPLPPLQISRGLSRAAQLHVKDQGPKGLTGHEGSNNSTPEDRMGRYGELKITFGENISYGVEPPRLIVIFLIIDDGVKDRGHRKNIFNPQFTLAGAGFGPHKTFEHMAVIDFAGGFIEKKENKEKSYSDSPPYAGRQWPVKRKKQ